MRSEFYHVYVKRRRAALSSPWQACAAQFKPSTLCVTDLLKKCRGEAYGRFIHQLEARF